MATHKGTQCLAKCASAPATTWAWKQHVRPPLNLSFKFSYYQTFRKKKQCELQNQYSWLFKKQNQRKDSAHSASMWSGVERLEVVSCQYCSCSTRTCLVEPISTSSITGVIQCARKIHQVAWHEFVPDNFGKSSSHPSQLQTLLKTACVCTQGVWFKGIDDIHQHLVSLGKLQHIFLFIRSKV